MKALFGSRPRTTGSALAAAEQPATEHAARLRRRLGRPLRRAARRCRAPAARAAVVPVAQVLQAGRVAWRAGVLLRRASP